jgi:hypothetical protein
VHAARAVLLLWARRAVRLLLPKEGRQLLGRAGGRRTSGTGRPAPVNQFVVADMLRNRLDAASTIAPGILDLRADLRTCSAKPLHFHGRQQPAFGAGRPMEDLRIRRAVTGATGKRLRANPAFAGVDVHTVRSRRHTSRLGPHRPAIAADMAIGAARVAEHVMNLAPGFQSGILCVGRVRQRKQHDCETCFGPHGKESFKPFRRCRPCHRWT